jgi:hypothetical protein
MRVEILKNKIKFLFKKKYNFIFIPSNVTRPSLSESIAAKALAIAESSLFAFE